MNGILFNLFSLMASLTIVRMAGESWVLAITFAIFWSLGLAISIATWWQWEHRLAPTFRSHHS
ncbi:MAG: hypothetical protein ACKOCD_07940 [Nitrospiraceae bacterium]